MNGHILGLAGLALALTLAAVFAPSSALYTAVVAPDLEADAPRTDVLNLTWHKLKPLRIKAGVILDLYDPASHTRTRATRGKSFKSAKANDRDLKKTAKARAKAANTAEYRATASAAPKATTRPNANTDTDTGTGMDTTGPDTSAGTATTLPDVAVPQDRDDGCVVSTCPVPASPSQKTCTATPPAKRSTWMNSTEEINIALSSLGRHIQFSMPISTWCIAEDVAYNMSGVFAYNPNLDISTMVVCGLDTSNVVLMDAVFKGQPVFNEQVNTWDTGKVASMSQMFQDTGGFNACLGQWQTSSVVSLYSTFSSAAKFNTDVNSWQTSNVETMSGTFKAATAFDKPLNNWTTDNVIDMSSMFMGATSFNRPLGSWQVSEVITMDNMFNEAIAFNQDISMWIPSKATSMKMMFSVSTSPIYMQNLSAWDVGAVCNCESFALGQTIDVNFSLPSFTACDVQTALAVTDCYKGFDYDSEHFVVQQTLQGGNWVASTSATSRSPSAAVDFTDCTYICSASKTKDYSFLGCDCEHVVD